MTDHHARQVQHFEPAAKPRPAPVWPWLALLGLIAMAFVLAPNVTALIDAPLAGSEW